MGITPDRSPGPLVEEEVQLEEQSTDPTVEGAIRYVSGAIKMRDATGVFDARSGTGLSEATHEVLDTLVHRLAEDSDTVITRSGGRITDVVVWTDVGHSTKIREFNITRASGKISVVVEKQYDGTGTLAQTLTHTITRSSGRIASIATVKT